MLIKQICLPMLLENNEKLLALHLKNEELLFVLEACSPYLNQTEDVELSGPDVRDISEHGSEIGTSKKDFTSKNILSWGSSFVKKSKSSRISVEGREDPEVCKVIQLLWNKPPIRQLVKDLLKDVSPEASAFLTHIKNLQVYTMTNISTTPLEEHAREKYLRRIWHHNEQLKEDISLFSTKLEEQYNEIQFKVIAKKLLINQYESKIERVNKKCKDDIRKRVYDSERRMISDWKESEIQQESLFNEVKTLEAKMKTMLSDHLAQEKEQRAKRLKVETQLINWLNKYDTDIGEKQAEYDEIMAGFEDEQRQMEELKEQFDTQQEEYERLMKEKADEEQRIHEEKTYLFLRSRAARRIQRYWRAYRARKLARKKGKKKRKGGGGGGGGSAKGKK
ncbi:hypothetical protein ANN_17044 [Periplaneta americana]|uniref:Dynein regulatory complex protein 10 n=1 Tax=Periplaneta americana TaxID=6978 RepID=A0ABQ8STA2_PERAM|nr:hypothetical protein ANN_17044 [Periplaneta americana]